MADLLDIAPSTAVEVVRLGEQSVRVRGISVSGIAAIVSAFPALRSLASENRDGGGDLVARLIAGCGQAIGPIIAAGCGRLGDEQYAQHAERLLPEHQIRLVRAIFGLTFPNGPSSFIGELTRLMTGAADAKTVKARLKPMRSKSPPSADPVSHPTMQ